MRMLKRYLRLELEEINRQNIRFQPIGRIEGLRDSVRRELERAVETGERPHAFATAPAHGLTLVEVRYDRHFAF